MNSQQKADKYEVIFILFSDLGIGGVQKKISDVVTQIKSRAKNSKKRLVILLNKKKSYDLENDIFLEIVLNEGAEVFYKPNLQFRRFELPYTLFVLWKAFVYKPDVILSFMESYAIASVFIKLLLFWRKVKVVISYDNVASIYIRSCYKKRHEMNKWTWAIRIFFRYADIIVLPSREAKKDMINNFRISKEIIIVNKNWITQFPRVSARNIVYDIIYTGRVDPAKNLKLFVDVVDEVSKKMRNISAGIIGWGDEITEVSKYIHKKSLQSRIEILGSQEDVHKFLISSKVFLLTSDFEGLPISVLEAMGCGLPAVVKAYPGADELVVDGRTGFIATTKKDLAERLFELLSNEKNREKFGKAARRYVKKYHGEKNLQSFIDLIDP